MGGPILDFKQLRSFVALVDYRNFSRAAEKLNIAQSSVSTHLLQLEKELGVTLANRTTKTLEITGAGLKVYKYASQILELEDCVQQACSADARRVLRIGATAIPATYILPTAMQQYRTLYVNDCLKVKECENRAVIEGVLDHRFDAGLTGQPVQTDGLVCTVLCRNQPVLITPATERYQQMKQQGICAAELLKEPVIAWERESDSFPDQLEISPANLSVVARVNDYETVKNLVSGGMGISVIPEVAARDFVKLHRILTFNLPPTRREQNIYLVYPEGCTSKDKVWNFIDYLLECNDLLKYI